MEEPVRFTVSLQDQSDIQLMVTSKYDDEGYETKIMVIREILPDSYETYGKLLSLINKHDTIFLKIIKEEINEHPHLIANYKGMKIEYLNSLVDYTDKPYIKVYPSRVPNEMSKTHLDIYTDGSCIVNEKIGGWAVVSKEFIKYGGKHPTTNNEMELYAILQAVQYIDTYETIHIYTDSEYAYKTLNDYAYRWESDGWKKKGGSIKNLEIIKEIFQYTKNNPNILISHVLGHNGNTMNEIADKMAKKAVEEYKKENL